MHHLDPTCLRGAGSTLTVARRAAFTLIEILIVVVILGILAAMVMPQFVNASDETNESSARRHLMILRQQIEYYRAQHNQNPDLLNDQWDDLLTEDYLHTTPVNPFNKSSVVANAAGPGVGWVWRDNGFGALQLYVTDATFNNEWSE